MHYQVKYTQFKGKRVAYVLQAVNGACPLLAISNVLLLQGDIHLHPEQEIIQFEELGQKIEAFLQERAQRLLLKDAEQSGSILQSLDDARSLLPKMETGLDINVVFSQAGKFEYTPEIAVFDSYGIRLIHGWVFDPQNEKWAKTLREISYNQLVDRLTTDHIVKAAPPVASSPSASSPNVSSPPTSSPHISSPHASSIQPRQPTPIVDIPSIVIPSANTASPSSPTDYSPEPTIVLSDKYIRDPPGPTIAQHEHQSFNYDESSPGPTFAKPLNHMDSTDSLNNLPLPSPSNNPPSQQTSNSRSGADSQSTKPSQPHETEQKSLIISSADHEVDSVYPILPNNLSSFEEKQQNNIALTKSLEAKGSDPIDDLKQAMSSVHLDLSDAEIAKLEADKVVMTDFLNETLSQLTYFGLSQMHQMLREEELCVFFRNNHFSTLFKTNGQLYSLVTDVGISQQDERIVWAKLSDVGGENDMFLDWSFQPPGQRLLQSEYQQEFDEYNYLLELQRQRMLTPQDKERLQMFQQQKQALKYYKQQKPEEPHPKRKKRKDSDCCIL